MDKLTELFGEAIHRYSRKEAIADGVLIDVSSMAQKAGFKVPIAITSAVYTRIETIPKAYGHESIDGRLWDVLCMLKYAVRNCQGRRMLFDMTLHESEDRRFSGKITLKAISGPGDDMEHVITITAPDED